MSRPKCDMVWSCAELKGAVIVPLILVETIEKQKTTKDTTERVEECDRMRWRYCTSFPCREKFGILVLFIAGCHSSSLQFRTNPLSIFFHCPSSFVHVCVCVRAPTTCCISLLYKSIKCLFCPISSWIQCINISIDHGRVFGQLTKATVFPCVCVSGLFIHRLYSSDGMCPSLWLCIQVWCLRDLGQVLFSVAMHSSLPVLLLLLLLCSDMGGGGGEWMCTGTLRSFYLKKQ